MRFAAASLPTPSSITLPHNSPASLLAGLPHPVVCRGWPADSPRHASHSHKLIRRIVGVPQAQEEPCPASSHSPHQPTPPRTLRLPVLCVSIFRLTTLVPCPGRRPCLPRGVAENRLNSREKSVYSLLRYTCIYSARRTHDTMSCQRVAPPIFPQIASQYHQQLRKIVGVASKRIHPTAPLRANMLDQKGRTAQPASDWIARTSLTNPAVGTARRAAPHSRQTLTEDMVPRADTHETGKPKIC